MRLSENNFSKHTCRFKQKNKIDIEGTEYSYETSKALYDVLVIGDGKYYRVNCKDYSSRIDSIHNIHRAIEKHYNL